MKATVNGPTEKQAALGGAEPSTPSGSARSLGLLSVGCGHKSGALAHGYSIWTPSGLRRRPAKGRPKRDGLRVHNVASRTCFPQRKPLSCFRQVVWPWSPPPCVLECARISWTLWPAGSNCREHKRAGSRGRVLGIHGRNVRRWADLRPARHATADRLGVLRTRPGSSADRMRRKVPDAVRRYPLDWRG